MKTRFPVSALPPKHQEAPEQPAERVVQIHMYGYGYAVYQVDSIFLPVRVTQLNGAMVFLLAADAPCFSSLKEAEAFFAERMTVKKPKIWLPPGQRGEA